LEHRKHIPRASRERPGQLISTRLIVTADDFGLAEEINEAVELAHRYGILSAASLMVAEPAAADAVRRARHMPGLRIGLHLVLVEGTPVLPAEQIPDLVERSGRMRCDLVRLAFELARSARLRSQLRQEIEAQFAAFLATGLPLDHVDVHKHYHLHPLVGREVIAAARRFGARAIRIPVEPVAVIARVERPKILPSLAFAAWATLLRPQARRAGLLAPDAVFGLAWSGAFTRDRLLALLRQLPRGVVEIYTHPATADQFRGSARGYRYSEELKALCASEIKAELERAWLEPIGYSDLAG
jgi:hopanoid biosynthesis associated protein HpnK